MRRWAGAAVALVASLALVAGCGSTPSTHPPATASPQPRTSPAAGGPSTTPIVAHPGKRRNILVIETDDMRWDELTFMPNVRRLILKRGLDFENSFAPYPLCCPSRASFLTGKYAHNHHVLSTESPFGFQSFDDHQTLATVLQRAGYQTALVGKYLNGYARQHIYHSKKSSLHYVPPGWTQWMAGSDHRFPVSSPLHGGTYDYAAMTQVINGQVVPHRGIYSSKLTAEQVNGVARTFGATHKPWFIWWTPVAPHFGNPHEADDPQPVLRSDGRLQRFPTPARPMKYRGMFDKRITHALGDPPHGPAEADVSDKPLYIREMPEMNAEEKIALTEVTRQRAESLYALDVQIGRTLAALKRRGQLRNTVLVFTSDNGYYLGEHRKRVGKLKPHEPSLRVPFLIAGPGIPRGKRYDPISTVDLAPTFASLAGLPGMPGADGRSLVPVILHGDQGWSAPVLTEARFGGYPVQNKLFAFALALNERGIRTARWKYVKYTSGEVELYDLATDPLEMNSRQNDPAYDAVKAQLEKIWQEYYDCAGAACQKPLPPGFRATPAQEKAITVNEIARTRSYYSDYPGHD